MKILQIGKYYPPYKGGMETVLENLAEGLASTGDEVTVLCSSEDSNETHEVIHGVRVIRLACYGKIFSQPLIPSLFFKIFKMAPAFDVLHFHSSNPLAEISGLILSLFKKVPIVVTFHSDIVRQRFLIPFYKPILRMFLRRTLLVAATENLIRYSKLIPDFQPRLTVIPFGIESANYVLSPEVQKRVREINRKYGRFALFVGRLVSYKGVKYLIEAMNVAIKQVPDLQLVVIGTGPLNADLVRQAGSCAGSGSIHFLGEVDENLAPFYHACEVFVLPSITQAEAFGVVLLEGMACGKPLISTKLNTGVVEVNLDQVTGLQVEPRDPDALAAAIVSIAMNGELRRKFGVEGHKRFIEKYTRQAMVQNYKKAYLRAMGS